MPFLRNLFKNDKKVIFIGLPGSGKSAFMIALYYDIINNYREYGISDVSVGGLFNLKKILSEIKKGVPPKKTIPGEINQFGLRLNVNGKHMRLFLEDWSGEHIKDFTKLNITDKELLRNPNNRKFINHLREYDVFLIFYDPTQKNKALLEQSRGLNRVMKIIRDDLRRKSASVAVVIPKCDVHPKILDNPEGWLTKIDLLFPFLKHNFSNVKAFGISAYGESKQIGKNAWVPAHDEFHPIGIKDVFEWIKKTLN